MSELLVIYLSKWKWQPLPLIYYYNSRAKTESIAKSDTVGGDSTNENGKGCHGWCRRQQWSVVANIRGRGSFRRSWAQKNVLIGQSYKIIIKAAAVLATITKMEMTVGSSIDTLGGPATPISIISALRRYLVLATTNSENIGQRENRGGNMRNSYQFTQA
jgi:hypothetical protein